MFLCPFSNICLWIINTFHGDWIYSLLFAQFLGPVCSQTNNPTIYTLENPVPVGSNVTLFSTTSVTQGVWLFNNELIVIILPGNSIISNTWSTRITFNSTSSSLSIRSLTVSDSGVYTLNAVNLFRAELTLSVQGKDHLALFMFTRSVIYLITFY